MRHPFSLFFRGAVFLVLIAFGVHGGIQRSWAQVPQFFEPVELAPMDKVVLKAVENTTGETSTIFGPRSLYLEQVPVGQFEVTFEEGYPEEAEDAVLFAVSLLDPLFNLSEIIKVHCTWQPSELTNLGSCGPSGYYALTADETGTPNIPDGVDFLTAVALAKQLVGSSGLPSPPEFDLVLNLNGARTDWYMGVDGMVPSSSYDVVSVAMHEVVHGMGFQGSVSSPEVIDGVSVQEFGDNLMVYDYFVETADGTAVSDLSPEDLAAALTSEAFFVGPGLLAVNEGAPAPLYTPSDWNGGSSYSHFDEDSYPTGDINSLMTPFLSSGAAIHTPGYLALALMQDLGYSVNIVSGCTHPLAENFDATATIDDESCTFDPFGCIDPTSCNFSPMATIDDGSCLYLDALGECGGGCEWVDAIGVCGGECEEDVNGNGLCDVDEVTGCMSTTACNYDPEATLDDGSCISSNYCISPQAMYLPFDLSGESAIQMTCLGSVSVPEGYYLADLDCASNMVGLSCQMFTPFWQNQYANCVCGEVTPETNAPPALDLSHPMLSEPLVAYCHEFNEVGMDAVIEELVALIGVTDECPDNVYVVPEINWVPSCGNAGIYNITLNFVDPYGLSSGWEGQFTIVDEFPPVLSLPEFGVEVEHWQVEGGQIGLEALMSSSVFDWQLDVDAQAELAGYISDGCVPFEELLMDWEAIGVSTSWDENNERSIWFQTLLTVADGCGNSVGQTIDIRATDSSLTLCGWWVPDEGTVGEAVFSCTSPGPGYALAMCQFCAEQTIQSDGFCINNMWDSVCQTAYDQCSAAGPAACDCDVNPFAVVDECGVCGGNGPMEGCGCDGPPEGDCDCFGNALDALGVCGGDCTADLNENSICDDEEVAGCMDMEACNFDEAATLSSGECTYALEVVYEVNTGSFEPGQEWAMSLEGTLDEPATGLSVEFNFESLEGALAGDLLVILCGPDGECVEMGTPNASYGNPQVGEFPAAWYTNAAGSYTATFDLTNAGMAGEGSWTLAVVNAGSGAGVWEGSAVLMNECPEAVLPGCTDATACNYDASATWDDGTCVFSGPSCVCTVSASVEAMGLGSGASETWSVSGALSSVDSMRVVLDFTSIAGNFAGDLMIGVCAPGGDCIEAGGYDLSLGYEAVGPFPGSWNAANAGLYEHTFDLTSFNLSGNGEWEITLFNAFTMSTASANWSGQVVLFGGCDDSVVCDSDSDGDGVCDADEVPGCTDPLATNYNPVATDDDGSCDFGTPDLPGCTNELANNFDPEATVDDGSCIYGNDEYYGCTYPQACNYVDMAVVDDGSCIFPVPYLTCTGECLNDADGDGVCDELEVLGCTDDAAVNFHQAATDDDGSCLPTLVSGCAYPQACNYSEEAEVDDGSCTFPELGFDCDGNPVAGSSCLGDLNDSGNVTIADLLVLLSVYGDDCSE